MLGKPPEGEELKSRGREMESELEKGEGKLLREGLKAWLLSSLLEKLGLKRLAGVAGLLDDGVAGVLRTGWSGVEVSSVESLFLRFLRECDSLSPLSKTTLAMRSNSEQIPSIRLTPPCSSLTHNMDKKFTTWFINFTSVRARAS